MIELSYLLYSPGAYYRKHVDHIVSSTTKNNRTTTHSYSSQRTVSFLLFLGDPSNNNDMDDDEDDDGTNDDDDDDDDDLLHSTIEDSSSVEKGTNNPTITRTAHQAVTRRRKWDCLQDGGALRIYGPAAWHTGYPVHSYCSTTSAKDNNDNNNNNNTQDDAMMTPESSSSSSSSEEEDRDYHSYYSDIPPHPGTLVLFESSTVPHEVLMTLRPRATVVGWFRSLIDVPEQQQQQEAGVGKLAR
jgi:hypothetical protein